MAGNYYSTAIMMLFGRNLIVNIRIASIALYISCLCMLDGSAVDGWTGNFVKANWDCLLSVTCSAVSEKKFAVSSHAAII